MHFVQLKTRMAQLIFDGYWWLTDTTYLWSNGSSGTRSQADSQRVLTRCRNRFHGCTKTTSATVLEPTIQITTVVASACNPVDNKYTVTVTVSWTNAPSTSITVTTTEGGSSTINIALGSSGTQTTTITGLTSNGVQDVDVKASFNANCFHTAVDAYDAPLSCIPAKIGDYVWEDKDADGVQEGGEPGIPNVLVTLTGTDQLGNPVNLTQTTDANGFYLFDDLVPGTYKLTFGQPAGYKATAQDLGGDDGLDSDMNPATFMTINTVLTPGETDLTWDAGFYKPAKIGDYVWKDLDTDGIQDGNESGIPNVTVTLTGTDGAGNPVNLTTSTDGAGLYLFDDLVPGTYKITFASPGASFELSPQDQGGDDTKDSDAAPGTLMTINTVLESGETDLTWDAGFYEPMPKIDLEKFVNGEDADNAPGVIIIVPNTPPNVTFTFTATNTGNLTLNNVEITDNIYGFICSIPSLAPGASHTCTITAPAMRGLHTNIATVTGQPVLPNNNPFGPPVDDEDPGNYTGVFINMDKSANKTEVCAGEEVTYTLITRMLGGTNGIEIRNVMAMDNNMPGTFVCNGAHWVTCGQNGGVLCDLDDDCVLDFTDPDNNGVSNEEFKWQYTLTLNQTTVNTANDMGEVWYVDPISGVETFIGDVGNNDEVTVTVNPNLCAEIGNYVWEDKDADGVQDGNETGIPNVTVTLTGTNADGNPVNLTTTTDGTGFYLFSGLVAGDYQVTFGTPVGNYFLSPQDKGGNDQTDSDAAPGTQQTIVTTLTVGESDLTWDAGFYKKGEIGDFVWEDKNANGVQDNGEPGIPNVTVTLTGTDGAGNPVTLTTTTDGNGFYLFPDLVPGTYKLTFGTPGATYFPTAQDLGGDDTKDSDINPGTLMTTTTDLTSGESDRTWDAGFYKKAEIGDYVWQDNNANGIQNGGEPGIPNVTVTLTGTDGAGNSVSLTTTTNGTGFYKFPDLVPGTYKLTFTSPGAGFNASPQDQGGDDALDSDGNPTTLMTVNTVLESGESDLTWDQGFYGNAELGNYVWEDTDADGIQDGNEVGIPNVSVTLTGTDGSGNPVNKNTTTDANGFYIFTNLVPGSYQVTFGTPAGNYFLSAQDKGNDDQKDSDAAPGTQQTIPTDLVAGESDLSWDAGFYKKAEIGDYVWEDKNGNGVQDGGEPGIPNVTVTLTGTDGAGNPVTLTTTTDGNGKYLFPDLVPGTYKLTFASPGAAYFPTAQDLGGNDATDSDINPGTLMTDNTDLVSGESDLTWDAGFYKKAEIGDFVWEDKNANGVQDNGEPGIPNVTVTLTGTDGAGNPVTLTTTTDGNGFYLFPDLVPGSYKLTFGTPGATYFPTAQDLGGDDTKDSDINPGTLMTTTTDLTSGESDRTWDAGFYKKAEIGDYVWQDNNANGIQDGGEPGIPNVTVTLTGTDGAGNAVNLTTTTNGTGFYLFPDLVPGTYKLTFTSPGAGFNASPQDQGGDDALDSDGNPTTLMTVNTVLESGESDLTWDQGFYGNAELGNYVWEDTDADGIQDGNEVGIPNVSVTLTGTDGSGNPVNKNTTTDANGFYIFTNLVPGSYQVTFGTPAGNYFLSAQDKGNDDLKDSDAAPGTQQTIPTDLVAGESDLSWDAGFYKKAEIGDYVWEDKNGNGVQDGGEPGIPNVTVTLTGTDGAGNPVTLTTTTDGTGKYLFPDLVPGTYKLTFGTPGANYMATAQDLGGNDATDSDINPGTLMTINTDLVSGESDLTWDAGFYKKAEIGNFVWYDLDKDGVQDGGEGGVPNLTVTLTGTDGAGNMVNQNTTTDGSGLYLFPNLAPGTYKITFTSPGAGYTPSPQDQGGNDDTDSDGNTGTLMTINTVLESGESDLSWDQGFFLDITLTTVVVNVSCYEGMNGSIDLTVAGGTAPYTFLWSNGATTEDLVNLSAGTYTVTVTDANGFTATISSTITQPPVLEVSTAVVDVLCSGGSDGDIDLTVTGGSPAYTYLWSNGATTQDLTNVVAGTYTVTVTDSHSCSKTISATINQPTPLVPSAVPSPVTCYNGTDGDVDLSVSGGSPAYTYLWSNGATTQDLTNVVAGTYTVTVTDTHGCTATTSATVEQPTDLALSVSVTDVVCHGGTDGDIDLSVSGGSPAYTYLWSNGATTQDLTNVVAGTYTVTVTDTHNCTKTISATINQPTDLVATAVPTPVLCNGGADGDIDVTVSGGSPAYTYLWSNGATTQDLTNVVAGTYTVTVTDTHNCTKTVSATITEPTNLTASAVASPVACFGGSDGDVDLTVSGGSPAYTYVWSNGATTQDLNNVIAGTYTVTVTDTHGCSITASATVTQPDALVLSTDVTNVSCNGGNTGAIDLTVTGGTLNYSYLWSNNATTQDISALAAGTYTVTVTDANDCTKSISATVQEASLLTASAQVTNILCNGSASGAIDVTVLGGTPGYSYLWNPGGATTEDLNNIVAGDYCVTVTDQNGCTVSVCKTVSQPPALVVTSTEVAVLCNGGADGSINLTVTGGVPAYQYLWSNGVTTQDLDGLSAGSYCVTVTDANGCTKTLCANITQPPVITLTDEVTDVSCYGGNNGAVNLVVVGGSPGYTYLWDNGATTQDLSNVTAGTYCVTVTDTHDCQAFACVTVGQPTDLVLSTSITNVACNGGNTGAVDLTVTGGSPAYTYDWSNIPGNNNPQDISNLVAGTYTVTVTDSHGCTKVIEAVVSESTTIVATTDVTNVLCNGGSDGDIDLTVSGGTPGYTYLWSYQGRTTEDLINVPAGTYTVTITDAAGCKKIVSATIAQPTSLSLSATVTDVACNGGSNGAINLMIAGGTPDYTFLWSNGQTSEDVNGLTAGTYTVTVTDDHGCTATLLRTVNEPTRLAQAFCANHECGLLRRQQRCGEPQRFRWFAKLYFRMV